MRMFPAILIFLPITMFAQSVPNQAKLTRAQAIEKVCRGPEITSGPEFDEIHSITHMLAPVVNEDNQHHIVVALVDNKEINAWDNNFNMADSLICVPIAMVHFMGDAQGELAFVIAHETGHALDDECKTVSGRAAIANQRGSLGAFVGGIFGGTKGAARVGHISAQRGCEARADQIGFYIFTKAGGNPFDAAGSFGRLEMYLGDTSTGVLARLNSLSSDHPMTPDRIKNMRMLLLNYEKEKQ